MLDSGSQLLLANMPTPWTFFCTHEDQIPNDIQGAKYALIQKSDLCLCSITAGSLYLHENIGSCAEDIPDLVSLNEDEIEKDYVQVPFGSYLSPEQFNTELDK